MGGRLSYRWRVVCCGLSGFLKIPHRTLSVSPAKQRQPNDFFSLIPLLHYCATAEEHTGEPFEAAGLAAEELLHPGATASHEVEIGEEVQRF